jgi:5'-nucleotidase|tara:strand:- start:696 stop:1472 length:777 start_codon:yes stop_codon:yes gene_type:complete
MSKRPLILITNDDGITAPGIRSLISVMNQIGDVVVVAPDSPQSAMGHAITITSTLHCSKIKLDNGPQKEYSCSGTPADCVKLAVNELLDRKPDICVSGINHGSNSSINVIYSGTMSAALEAGIEGIPAIGFSLLDYRWGANFEPLKPSIMSITKNAIKNGIPQNVVLNVNMPKIDFPKDLKGIKICRQAKAHWIEKFDKRTNPMGKEYYWLTGDFINEDKGQDTDEWALKKNFISIVPVQYDLTAHHAIHELNTWDFG